jgi:hypothetical protein
MSQSDQSEYFSDKGLEPSQSVEKYGDCFEGQLLWNGRPRRGRHRDADD